MEARSQRSSSLSWSRVSTSRTGATWTSRGPTGGGRHVGDPAVVAHHDAFAGFELGVHDVLQEVATGLLVVGLGVLEFLLHLRGDERVAVDLAVRVSEGDADFLTVVLEREDLLDAFHLGDFGGTEGPSLNTVRRRETGRSAGRPSSFGSKQMTSQRPAASFFSHSGLPST